MKTLSKIFALAVMLALFSAPVRMTANVDDDDQPHMQAALEALKQAAHHLQEAKHDKGGHRAAALKATQAAIHHVQAGMEVGEHHEHK